MTSTAGSTKPPARPVRRAAVVTHGRAEVIGEAVERVREVAARAGVEIVPDGAESEGIDIAIVLGGDGTMLRALTRFLGAPVPVIGVNFGRVGFLSSMTRDELETGLARVFAGDYVVVELPTIEVETGGARYVAVNDAVVTSGVLGRMVELEWAVGGEDLGTQPCDGVICSTPSGSTAYNLSNGGPVLVWGIDAMAITFVAPHSLQARPLVVPRGRDLVVSNRTANVPVAVLVDGHHVADAGPRDGQVTIRLGAAQSLLATLPEATFVRRYRQSFAS
jgi:NAD+ kinase